MPEIWKPIREFEGLYEVSNLGQVRSVDRKCNIHHNSTRNAKGKILKPDVSKFGYKRVALSKENNVRRYLVHRLVADAFIPNPNNYPIVNHKDEDPGNCSVSNLEWCDASYNNSYNGGYSKRLGARKTRGTAKTDPRPVIATSVKDGSEIRYDSISDAQRDGFHNAGLAVRGLRPTCKGYRFRYDN